ncbi:protein transport protein bet1 [Cladochytrium tenue]|nr:protein transport protein bet1 [Cladochytrium tenue]
MESSYADSQYALEQQNDDHVDMLSEKMRTLREISVQIGDEVSYQERMLNGMEDDFSKTGDILGTAMRRLNVMARTQSGRWVCALILFVIVTIFYLVFIRRRS